MHKTLAAALVAVPLLAPSAQAAPAPVAAAPPFVSAAAEVRLPHISVVKLGRRGSPVVLIPGLASPRAVWDSIAPSLAAGHVVYLVQVNGFAGDDPGANLAPDPLAGIVADLDSFLRREKAPPVRLIGHSMGGLAGLMFARAHPEAVDRLMVVDALPFFSVLLANGGPEPSVAEVEPIARTMRDRVAATYGRPADPAAVEANVRSLALKPASLVLMKRWAAAADPRVTAAFLYADMTTDLRPALPAIRTPLTVLFPWSESGFGKERTTAFYRRQYAGAAKAEFVDVADAGHFVMLDQPEAFRGAVERFLADGK
jgi:pimeloyl-ACP methyl ester carboxylesterase